jgi:hypothetical protein
MAINVTERHIATVLILDVVCSEALATHCQTKSDHIAGNLTLKIQRRENLSCHKKC